MADVTVKTSNQFRFLNLDLISSELGSELENVDVVFNLAAMPGLVKSWTHFSAYSSSNLLLVQKLLESICKVNPGIHLVHASTSSVYGANAIGSENQNLNPFSPYGVTKLAAENLISAYSSNFHIRHTILRYFSVYGPNQRPDMAYQKFCQRLLAGQDILIHGDGSHLRSPTFVSDIVDSTIRAGLAKPQNEIFNLAGNQQISTLDALSIIADCLNIRPRIEFIPSRAGDQVETFGDSSKANAEFGHSPTVTPEEGLRRQADWNISQITS